MKTCIILCLLVLTLSQKLYFHSPSELKNTQIKFSPIGYNPRSGQLDGTLVLADPFDACTPINNVQNSEEDVFILVNDQTCLQSTKARNIMKSGGIVGIVRQNVNTSLHDKQSNIVHIPIVQLSPQIFDKIVQQMNSNKTAIYTATLQFSSDIVSRDISIELWMSPTEIGIYSFLVNMQKFLNNQKNEVNFWPRYVLHSQKQRKTFIGCYSNGMYCPGEIEYDGKMQGQNVIAQSLRQIVIRNMGLDIWWKYAKYYYIQCLQTSSQDIMMNEKSLTLCSRNSMMLAGIDYDDVQKQVNQSFVGSRKQVDDNILLNEERQDYIRQKITTYPVMLINKKQFDRFEASEVKQVICKMEHTRSTQCSQMINGDLNQGEVYLIIGIVLIIIVVILIVYKIVMYRRMQRQMKTQVTSTLEQYYRYMQTLDGENDTNPRIYKTKPDSSNRIQNQNSQNHQDHQDHQISPQIEIQMGSREQARPQKRNKSSKQGHQNLVEEQ